MVSSSQSLASGLLPVAPLKLSQTSFVARVPVSNSPALPTTGPDGAGLVPVGGLAFHRGGRFGSPGPQAAVDADRVALAEVLPAASNASTPSTYEVAQARLLNVYDVPPEVETCEP